MASSDRPSGLTALAVINFMFGTLELLGGIGLISLKVISSLMLANSPDHMNEEERATFELVAEISWIDFGIVIALAFATGLLLVLSGIGYLKRKKFLGRLFGNVYAVVAVVYVIVTLTVLPEEVTEGFSLAVIRSLFYPCFTLYLLNVTFRRDLAR